MAKYCHNCGAALDVVGRFCPSCGASLQVPSVPEGAVPQSAQRFPQPVQTQPTTAQQPPFSGDNPYAASQSAGYGYRNPYAGGQNAGYYGGNPYGQAAAYFGQHYVPDQGFSEMFFRSDNRLNRKRYILRGLALFGIGMVVLFFLYALVGVGILADSPAFVVLGIILVLLFSVVSVVPSFMLMIRRLHDTDQPGWWCLGIFIPVLDLALGLYLLFAEGTRGPNRYGPDPLEGQH